MVVCELPGRGVGRPGSGLAARRPCPIYSRGFVTVPGDPSDRIETWAGACAVAVLQFGDDVLWGGTFPFLTRAVFCDFRGELGGGGGEKEKLLCCSPADKTKRCHALPAKWKHAKVWNRLCSGVRAL